MWWRTHWASAGAVGAVASVTGIPEGGCSTAWLSRGTTNCSGEDPLSSCRMSSITPADRRPHCVPGAVPLCGGFPHRFATHVGAAGFYDCDHDYDYRYCYDYDDCHCYIDRRLQMLLVAGS